MQNPLAGRSPLLGRCPEVSNFLLYHKNSSAKCVSEDIWDTNKLCSCGNFNSAVFSFYSFQMRRFKLEATDLHEVVGNSTLCKQGGGNTAPHLSKHNHLYKIVLPGFPCRLLNGVSGQFSKWIRLIKKPLMTYQPEVEIQKARKMNK